MSLPKFPILRELDFENAVCQILSSIAMEELGLSHIINAEGEKLQYILGTLGTIAPEKAATVEQILEVNESVMATLRQVGFSQMFLNQKMSDALKAYEKYQQNGGTKEEIYYKPVGKPPNVYEIVDKDGNGKQPPEYIYNPGEPGDGNDRDAYRDENGNFWVEEIPPGNVWIPIDDNGNLEPDNAIWGGANGKPGGGDDKPVQKFGNSWWLDMGQNVFKQVTGKFTLGPLTSGGPSHDPAITPGRPVYESATGQYFIKNGTDMYGNDLYYGDPPSEGNGLLESTQSGLGGDDVLYYMDKDGNMTTERPVTVVSVVIDPPSAIMEPSTLLNFNAHVTRSDGSPSPEGVKWSISPKENVTLTSPTESSVEVTVGSAASPNKFTLTATSAEDGKTKGTAIITIASTKPSNVNVELSPKNATYTVGNPPLEFEAKVSGTNLIHGEKNDAVIWTVSPLPGATIENGKFTATVPGTYTVTATAKDDSTKKDTATVTVKTNGVPDIEHAGNGETIVIDDNEWIKLRSKTIEGKNYALLMLKDTIGEFQYAPNSTGTTYYKESEIKINVNAWYDHLKSPTLESIASQADTGTADESWPVSSGTGIYAHLPHKGDVDGFDTDVRRVKGKEYWLASPTSVQGGGNAYQETVKSTGVYGVKGNSSLAHARPVIWVHVD